jgi:hypothetical protein
MAKAIVSKKPAPARESKSLWYKTGFEGVYPERVLLVSPEITTFVDNLLNAIDDFKTHRPNFPKLKKFYKEFEARMRQGEPGDNASEQAEKPSQDGTTNPKDSPLSEADQKVWIGSTTGSCGKHLEKVAEKLHQLSMMLYDINDEGVLAESVDIVAGVGRILDGLGTDIAKVGEDLVDLKRIAHARGIN